MEIEAHGYYAHADAKPIHLTGNWESTWGTVSIRQEGSTINGCYEYRDGLITNAGMERRLLTYKWLEVGENGMGHAVLVVNEEGNRLNGIWGFGNDLKRYGIWTFKKMGETPTLKDGNMKIKIAGHTDHIGSEESNLTLSENRAKSVVDYLVERGISQDRCQLLYDQSFFQ
jgi:hypothetical protein